MRSLGIILVIWQCCSSLAWADQSYILDSKTQQHISQAQLVAELAQADVVLLGEKHDEPKQHQLQLALIQQARQVRPQAAFLLEMLTPAQQRSVDRVKQWLADGGHSAKRSLASKMDWNMAWDWAQYQDLVFDLMHSSAKVMAANPDVEQIKLAGGFVPQGERSANLEVRQALAMMMGQQDAMHALVGKQQFKDHSMSQVILAAPKPAWLIAGAIHSSKMLGVPLFLADDHYQGRVKVLIMTELGTEIDPQQADFIYFIDPN